jgi:hypothetical protein
MKIDRILSGLRQTQDTTKEAAVSAVAPSTEKVAAEAPRDALVSALNSALTAAPSAEKTASAKANPVADVMKVAEELAATEQEANIKHAQVMGAAFADAFVSRMGVWQAKAAELNQQPVVASPSNFGKLAQENPALLTQAQNLGYQQTKAALDKQANDAYVAGFNDTVNAIHKTASDEFVKGAQVMNLVLNAAIQG